MNKHTPDDMELKYIDAFGVAHIGTTESHLIQCPEEYANSIVRACNSHDELVKALEICQCFKLNEIVHEIIKKALAKAKEE